MCLSRGVYPSILIDPKATVRQFISMKKVRATSSKQNKTKQNEACWHNIAVDSDRFVGVGPHSKQIQL